MRVRVTYKASKLPKAYRFMFVSLLKKALYDYDKEFFKELYFYTDKQEGRKDFDPAVSLMGEFLKECDEKTFEEFCVSMNDATRKNKKTKDFTFAIYLKDFKDCGKDLSADEIVLNISSPNQILMIFLCNALTSLNHFCYEGKYSLEKKNIRVLRSRKITTDYGLFKTMSPIAVKNKSGKFLDITDKEYQESLNYIINQTLKNYRNIGLIQPIEFIPVDMKKVVVQEKIKGFTEKTGKEFMYINSYTGAFILKGNPIDLNDIYDLGIGFRRSQGFGMIELA